MNRKSKLGMLLEYGEATAAVIIMVLSAMIFLLILGAAVVASKILSLIE